MVICILCAHCLRTRTDDAGTSVVEVIIIIYISIDLWRLLPLAAEYHNNTYHNIIHVVDTVLTVVYCSGYILYCVVSTNNTPT